MVALVIVLRTRIIHILDPHYLLAAVDIQIREYHFFILSQTIAPYQNSEQQANLIQLAYSSQWNSSTNSSFIHLTIVESPPLLIIQLPVSLEIQGSLSSS